MLPVCSAKLNQRLLLVCSARVRGRSPNETNVCGGRSSYGSITDRMPAPATIAEGGLVAMVRLLAAELGSSGIAVNGVCPIGSGADQRAIASALLFLGSADASYVSGVLVPVFG